MAKTFKKIFTDMIPVILGVLIALFINNWKESSDNKRFLKNVLESIDQELQADKEDLEVVLPKQYALSDTIKTYLDDPNVSVMECILKTNGIKVIPVKNTSWWSFLNAKIEVVGYETIAKLSELESSKQFMQLKMSKMMDFIYKSADSSETSEKKMLLIQILHLIESEEGLVKTIEEYQE